MISPSAIAEGIGGALVVCWGLWTEIRLRQAQACIFADKLQIEDDKIEKKVDSLSAADLKSALDKELGGSVIHTEPKT